MIDLERRVAADEISLFGSGNQRPRIGPQTWSPRFLDQAKGAREKLVFGFRSADINHGRCRQLLLEDVEEFYSCFLVERSNRFIYNHPTRFVEQHAREGEALLVRPAQFLVPSRFAIEPAREI